MELPTKCNFGCQPIGITLRDVVRATFNLPVFKLETRPRGQNSKERWLVQWQYIVCHREQSQVKKVTADQLTSENGQWVTRMIPDAGSSWHCQK